MKVVLITGEFPPQIGGVAGYTYHLSLALSAEKVEVFVITSYDPQIPKSIESRITVLPIVKKWNTPGILKALKSINKIKPDWILLQYVPQMYSRLTVPLPVCLLGVLVRLMGYRLLTVFHEIAFRIDFARPKYLLPAFFQRIIAYMLCVFSDRIVVCLEKYKNMLYLFNKKISKIPVGSNIFPVNITDDEKRELKIKIAPLGEIIIVTFGKITRRADLLLEVTRELKDQGVAVSVLFIGAFAQDWIERMKSKAKDLRIDNFCCFFGFLKSEDVYRHLLISDIYLALYGSDKKGRGGVKLVTNVAAAYAAGLPIIADKGDMTDDFFKDKENIFLLERLETEDIVDAIKKLMQDNKLRNHLRDMAQETYNERLRWSVITEKYLEVIGRANTHLV